MHRRTKWAALLAVASLGGATMQACLADFTSGLLNKGWPTNNFWINVGVDVVKEAVFADVVPTIENVLNINLPGGA